MASTLDEYQDLVQELRKSPETAGSEKLSKFLRLVGFPACGMTTG
jgi:hypothetical protein